MIRPSAQRAAAAAAALLILAGCGGGGGGGDSAQSDSAPLPSAAPVAAAAAAPTDMLYGAPQAPNADDLVASLPGYDEMGAPRDAFVPIVKDPTSGSGNGPAEGTGATPAATVPYSAPAPLPAPTAVPTTPVTPAPTGPAPAPTPSGPAPAVEGYEADFDIGGEPVVARVGDAVPPETQQFTVDRISVGSVVLKLNGGLLPDGGDTVTLKEGQSLTLVNQTSNVTYKLKLLEIRRI